MLAVPPIFRFRPQPEMTLMTLTMAEGRFWQLGERSRSVSHHGKPAVRRSGLAIRRFFGFDRSRE